MTYDDPREPPHPRVPDLGSARLIGVRIYFDHDVLWQCRTDHYWEESRIQLRCPACGELMRMARTFREVPRVT